MNRFLQRVIAYVVDILVVSIFATCISNVRVINFQFKDYNKVYDSYLKENEEYKGFVKKIKECYKDKKISEKEVESLEKEYKEYSSLVKAKYEDNKISEKEYNRILSQAEDQYEDSYKDYYYQIKKYSIVTNLIYVAVILLYFVGFQALTGQTLGKKLMKLKVASTKGDGKVKPMQYFIRALILYNTIFYFIEILVVLSATKNIGYNILYGVGLLQNVIEWIILFMIAMNQDGRGLHDYLASTIVIGVNEEYNHVKSNIKDAAYEEVKHKDATVEEVTKVETGIQSKEEKKSTAKKTIQKKKSSSKNKKSTKKIEKESK